MLPSGGAGGADDAFVATPGACNDVGWTSLTIAWNDLGYGDVQDGGFTACAPPGFELEEVNATFRWTLPDSAAGGPDAWAMTMLGGNVGTDHAYPLQRLRDMHTASCASPGYARRLLAIDGWPAIEVRSQEPAPVCGACPGLVLPQPTTRQITIAVAIDRFVVMALGRAAGGASSEAIEGLLAIGESITSDIAPPTQAELDQELAMLEADLASCP